MSRLTKKQEAFAVAIAKGEKHIDAYRSAYDAERMSPEAISVEASRLLARPNVSLRIDQLRGPALRKAEITVERTLQEIARLSYFDPRKLYRDDGELKRPDEWDDETAAGVASVEVLEQFDGKGEDRKLSGYTKKLKIWDKNAALEKAMKHLGLYERDNAQRAENLALQVVFVGTPQK